MATSVPSGSSNSSSTTTTHEKHQHQSSVSSHLQLGLEQGEEQVRASAFPPLLHRPASSSSSSSFATPFHYQTTNQFHFPPYFIDHHSLPTRQSYTEENIHYDPRRSSSLPYSHHQQPVQYFHPTGTYYHAPYSNQQYIPYNHLPPPPSQQQAYIGDSPSSTSASSSPNVARRKSHSSGPSGPIPASKPIGIMRDGNGVEWITFEYSRERVKTDYRIRADVQSVDTDRDLDDDFKVENCIYPRAHCPPEEYNGNRHGYETECNKIGWQLAWLNPCLRGKRGLIQRAVDSWRNRDPKLRSRRVKRLARMDPSTTHRVIEIVEDSWNEGNRIKPITPQGEVVGWSRTRTSPCGGGTVSKRPKYILLEDPAKGARVRVKITIEDITLEEIPEPFREANCVYPTHLRDAHAPNRAAEMVYNEIGWKLAWINMRLFADRASFLQRAVDAYRNKVQGEVATRPGRGRWLSRDCARQKQNCTVPQLL